ncbi:hypothetical protein ACFWFF_12495 [Streptomyces sp. NPDC060223]|uniref:hypothetical protein n=1 Tax=unclassified Streptomyces TaxID=2593676 RepID=UPI00363E5D99
MVTERREPGLHGREVRRGSGLLVALLVLSGCGGTGARGADATTAVEAFERAVTSGRALAACALLAPETRDELEDSGRMTCVAALGEEQLPEGGPVRSVDVYGRQAMVTLRNDTLFLSQFPGGWRVVAAGCEPERDRPYKCQVKGA